MNNLDKLNHQLKQIQQEYKQNKSILLKEKNLSDNSYIPIDTTNKLAFLLKLMSKISPNGIIQNSFSMTVQDRQLFIDRKSVIGLPQINW